MAQVKMSYACVIYPMEKGGSVPRPYKAMIVGQAWQTDLEVGGGPIILPPVDQPPPVVEDPSGGITITVKPAPAEGGWGINTEEGYYFVPPPGEARPKRG